MEKFINVTTWKYLFNNKPRHLPVHQSIWARAFEITSDLEGNMAVHSVLEVTDGKVVRAGVSVKRNLLSWSAGHELEPQSNRTWGVWYFCLSCTFTQKIRHVYALNLWTLYTSPMGYIGARVHSTLHSYSASRDKWCTVGGDGGCRVGEVRAGTTSPMPDHKGFKLQ